MKTKTRKTTQGKPRNAISTMKSRRIYKPDSLLVLVMRGAAPDNDYDERSYRSRARQGCVAWDKEVIRPLPSARLLSAAMLTCCSWHRVVRSCSAERRKCAVDGDSGSPGRSCGGDDGADARPFHRLQQNIFSSSMTYVSDFGFPTRSRPPISPPLTLQIFTTLSPPNTSRQTLQPVLFLHRVRAQIPDRNEQHCPCG